MLEKKSATWEIMGDNKRFTHNYSMALSYLLALATQHVLWLDKIRRNSQHDESKCLFRGNSLKRLGFCDQFLTDDNGIYNISHNSAAA